MNKLNALLRIEESLLKYAIADKKLKCLMDLGYLFRQVNRYLRSFSFDLTYEEVE